VILHVFGKIVLILVSLVTYVARDDPTIIESPTFL